MEILIGILISIILFCSIIFISELALNNIIPPVIIIITFIMATLAVIGLMIILMLAI